MNDFKNGQVDLSCNMNDLLKKKDQVDLSYNMNDFRTDQVDLSCNMNEWF